jgi:hypothetical protein
MFGRKRRKVVEHVTAALRPLVGTVQHTHGIPPRFWQDHFVLGFFHFMIAFHLKFTSGAELSLEDKGRVVSEVFTNLSNMNGVAIGRSATNLVTASPKSSEFESGCDNASVMAYYTYGMLKDADSNPHVLKAKEMAKRNGTPHNHGAVCGFLGMLLFFRPLQEKFGLGVS